MSRETTLNPTLSGRRILLVEDNPSEGRLFAGILSRHGAEVVLECNGQAAVEMLYPLHGYGASVDAVVMDLVLGEPDGCEVTAELRKRGFTEPICIITGSNEPADQKRCHAAGCDDFIRKSSAACLTLVDTLTNLFTVSNSENATNNKDNRLAF